MKTLYFLTFLIITLAPLKVSAQNFSHMEVYDSDFVFSDGVYLTKDDFIKNHPIDKSRINSEFNSDDLTYLEQVMSKKKFSYYNSLGSEITVDVASVFGYCSYGTLYVNHNDFFSRIGLVGNICHFLGQKTVFTDIPTGIGYFGPYYTRTTSTEMQQYFLVFRTGEILEYNATNLEKIIADDKELSEEYKELSKRKKNSKLFYYMRRYNEKHPLYIPVYE